MPAGDERRSLPARARRQKSHCFEVTPARQQDRKHPTRRRSRARAYKRSDIAESDETVREAESEESQTVTGPQIGKSSLSPRDQRDAPPTVHATLAVCQA